MFRAMFSPIFRSNLTVYTALVQCTDLLPTGDTVEMKRSIYDWFLQVFSVIFRVFQQNPIGILKFSPISFSNLNLRTKWLPQPTRIEYPQSMSLL
jgi:hypothetical protein